MSDFGKESRARCPRCKMVFSLDDGPYCDCMDGQSEREMRGREEEEERIYARDAEKILNW